MEKEQIVKALAHWAKNFDGKLTDLKALCEALTLILEQEKRIEELTLENAGFEAGAKAAARFIQADTVSKMQEKFTMHFGTYTPKDEVKISEVFKLLSKFAKEMLEDVTPPAKLLSLEDVSRAIKDYCCDLIDAGKDMVEATEFNADLQKILTREIFGKENE